MANLCRQILVQLVASLFLKEWSKGQIETKSEMRHHALPFHINMLYW
jgi:hypothetical protein